MTHDPISGNTAALAPEYLFATNSYHNNLLITISKVNTGPGPLSTLINITSSGKKNHDIPTHFAQLYSESKVQ